MNKEDDLEYIPPEKLRSKDCPLLASSTDKVEAGFFILEALFFIPRMIMRIMRMFN